VSAAFTNQFEPGFGCPVAIIIVRGTWCSSPTPPRMRFAAPLAQRAVACDMPIDVVQTILGYASLQTTSISVRVEQRGYSRRRPAITPKMTPNPRSHADKTAVRGTRDRVHPSAPRRDRILAG
jgi:hypothetical protein